MTRLFLIAWLTLAVAPIPCAAKAPLTTNVHLPMASASDYWDGFSRYWRRQFGQTNGVVMIVLTVVGVGTLFIISARRKN